jgi:hypothetical protein
MINYIFIIVTTIFIIYLYGHNTGACKINKKYICNNDFCLYKELNITLPNIIQNEILIMLNNSNIQKRVDITTYPYTFLNCGLPNKKGISIVSKDIIKYAPNLINYYTNDLRKYVSNKANLNLFSTNLNFPTSIVLLIYEKEGDWINYHYDYNYYNGRFFTLLIPIINNSTCVNFQFKNDNNEINKINLTNNNSILFEGNYLYHGTTKLCKNEKRVLLSIQYVTYNNITFFNKLRLNLKDYAYIGKIF